MAKSVFDYDTQEDSEETKVGSKRKHCDTDQGYLDKLMLSQKNIIDDIEKYCHSKRLKKNIFKMDCIRFGHQGASIDSGLVTMGASEAIKLTGNSADPVIEYQFKKKNTTHYQNIMQNHTDKLLRGTTQLPFAIHEGDLTSMQKAQDFEELMLTRQSSTVSMSKQNAEDVQKQKEKAMQQRMRMLDDLTFQKGHDNDSMETYKQKVSNDFNEFKRYNERCKQIVIEQRKEAFLKEPRQSQIPA